MQSICHALIVVCPRYRAGVMQGEMVGGWWVNTR